MDFSAWHHMFYLDRETDQQGPSAPKFWAGPLKMLRGPACPRKRQYAKTLILVKSDTGCWKFFNLDSTDSNYC